jgi:hypothetical protein
MNEAAENFKGGLTERSWTFSSTGYQSLVCQKGEEATAVHN